MTSNNRQIFIQTKNEYVKKQSQKQPKMRDKPSINGMQTVNYKGQL